MHANCSNIRIIIWFPVFIYSLALTYILGLFLTEVVTIGVLCRRRIQASMAENNDIFQE